MCCVVLCCVVFVVLCCVVFPKAVSSIPHGYPQKTASISGDLGRPLPAPSIRMKACIQALSTLPVQLLLASVLYGRSFSHQPNGPLFSFMGSEITTESLEDYGGEAAPHSSGIQLTPPKSKTQPCSAVGIKASLCFPVCLSS